MKSAEHTDWLDHDDQQIWFDRHKSGEGLRFAQFQNFLKATIYCYFAKFPIQTDNTAIDYREKPATRSWSANADGSEQQDESHGFTRQQEMRLFQTFDLKNDHVLDRDEFALMCARWLVSIYKPSCGLIVVDVQNDFIDGSLALINGPAKQDGAAVLPVINELIGQWQRYPKSRSAIVYTQDWHPSDHIGFHENLYMRKYVPKDTSDQDEINANENGNDLENHAKSFKYKKFLSKVRVFDTVLFEDGRVEQKLWPTHCIQNSWGAQLHEKLHQVPDAIRIQKGTLSNVDAYSVFWDNMRINETGLKQELIGKKVSDLFFCGLALDFCVAASALDALREGFLTFVVLDACRGIDEQEMEARKVELVENGAFIVQSYHVKDYLMFGQQNHMSGCNHINMDRDFVKTVAFRKATIGKRSLSQIR